MRLRLLACGLVLFGVFVFGCKPNNLERRDPQLAKFVAAKRQQARALVTAQNAAMPKEGWQLFDAVLADDWSGATNLFGQLIKNRTISGATPAPLHPLIKSLEETKRFSERLGLYRPKAPAVDTAVWQTLSECYWAYLLSKTWNRKFLQMFANEVFATVGTNSIYFG